MCFFPSSSLALSLHLFLSRPSLLGPPSDPGFLLLHSFPPLWRSLPSYRAVAPPSLTSFSSPALSFHRLLHFESSLSPHYVLVLRNPPGLRAFWCAAWSTPSLIFYAFRPRALRLRLPSFTWLSCFLLLLSRLRPLVLSTRLANVYSSLLLRPRLRPASLCRVFLSLRFPGPCAGLPLRSSRHVPLCGGGGGGCPALLPFIP